MALKNRYTNRPAEWNRAQQIELDQLNDHVGEKNKPNLTPYEKKNQFQLDFRSKCETQNKAVLFKNSPKLEAT